MAVCGTRSEYKQGRLHERGTASATEGGEGDYPLWNVIALEQKQSRVLGSLEQRK